MLRFVVKESSYHKKIYSNSIWKMGKLEKIIIT